MKTMLAGPDLKRAWFYVHTPAFYCKYLLPTSDAAMTSSDWRQYNELLALACQHGTYVRRRPV